MINFNFTKHCTGCAVCCDSCPVSCISLVQDKCGFLIPKIDNNNCILCNKCETVCPVLNTKHPNVDRHVYLAYNKDTVERKYGSSGSIMLILARFILKQDGVVYGAKFDEHLQLSHSREVSFEGVKCLSKSKYVQSKTEGTYSKVKDDLLNDKFVLFVGTPCQTQALNNFLVNVDCRKLILVDFLCHGVPSQALFNKAINKFETDNKCKVTGFSFREKSQNRLRNYKIWYTKDNTEFVEEGIENDFPYYYGYLRYFPFRESCYECKFANINRVADITIADMWGIEWSGDVHDFHKGYSLVYTNNAKGSYFFEIVKNELHFKEFDIDDPRTNNYTYINSTICTYEHKLFRVLYPLLPYILIDFLFFNHKRRDILKRIQNRVLTWKKKFKHLYGLCRL